MKKLLLVALALAVAFGIYAYLTVDRELVDARIACEDLVAQEVGAQVDNLDFQHRERVGGERPDYIIGGSAAGGGQSFVYECQLTKAADGFTSRGVQIVNR